MSIQRWAWLLALAVGCTSPTASLATRRVADAGRPADAGDSADDDDPDGENEHEEEDEECEPIFRECEDGP